MGGAPLIITVMVARAYLEFELGLHLLHLVLMLFVLIRAPCVHLVAIFFLIIHIRVIILILALIILVVVHFGILIVFFLNIFLCHRYMIVVIIYLAFIVTSFSRFEPSCCMLRLLLLRNLAFLFTAPFSL